jgi:ParB/RepB/Spo0J family partition protein
MTKAVQKITLSPSRDIPFNKLVLSQSNVRRVKAGVSIEQLAESIAQRTLLQSLSVRAVVDADGNETGMFEVPAGGRRYRALELLVKQKRMSKTQAVPCVIREGGIAEDDSVAENDERVGLHPLDQFRAFQTLRDLGMTEEDIAARHFVKPAIVKQRLRLASVSPKLHEVYADDGMTLEQLMAFSVTADHTRQDQVWENVSRSGYDEPYQIRRLLTENTVRGSDRRAQYVGIDAYEQAGGPVLRDLFENDDGGCRSLFAFAYFRRITASIPPNQPKGQHLVGLGRTHGLLEGDRTASGPGRQWLRPAIFRRALSMERQLSMPEGALCIAKQNSRPSQSSAALRPSALLRVLARPARRLRIATKAAMDAADPAKDPLI